MATRSSRGACGAALVVCSLAVAGVARGQTAFVGANFTGSNLAVSGWYPPDTMGAIGPDHFVESLNGVFAVYNRAGSLMASSSLNSFFTSAGVATGSSFDPRVAYDPNSGRWFVAAADSDGAGGSGFLLAVSKTSDPTAGWNAFRIDGDPTNTRWVDFPTLSYNRDAVVLGGDLAPFSGSDPFKTALVVIPKADLLAPAPTVAHRTDFLNLNADSTGIAQQAVVDRDGTFPVTVLSANFGAPGTIQRSTIAGTATSPTLTIGGSVTGAPAANAPLSADQPGPKPNLDSGYGWFAGSVVSAGGSIWAVQGIDSGGRAAARWLRINPATNAVVESGVISSPTLAYTYPSIAANGQGGVVIGFTAVGSSKYASTYAVAGRTTGGVTTFGTPFQTQAGASDYVDNASNAVSRWGDYSNTTVDPTDPDVYWTIQEYVPSTDSWATKVTEIIAPPPGQVRWKTGTNGTYGTAANWLAGAAPTTSSDLVFSNYGSTYTVTFTGSTTAASLTARRGNVTLALGAGRTLNLTRTSSPALNVADSYGTASLTLPTGTVAAQSATVGYASGGTGTLNLTGAAVTLTGALTVANANGTVNLSAGSLVAPSLSLAGTLNFTGGALAAGSVSIPGGRLNVAASGTRTLRVTSLAISAGGKLDLNDNDGVIDYTGTSPAATVRSYLAAGYNAGNWDGAGGVDSTSAKNAAGKHTALAYAEASAVLGLTGSATTTWSGVTVDATTLLIKYTWYGDANLDGKVTADDYALLDRGYAKHLTGWTNGDFNYDNAINSGDYLLADAAFASQTGTLSPDLLALRESQFGSDYVTALMAAVPEPGALVGCLVLPPILRPRRRAVPA